MHQDFLCSHSNGYKPYIQPFQRLFDLIPSGFRGPLYNYTLLQTPVFMYHSPLLADTSTDRCLDSDSYADRYENIQSC